MVVSSYRRFLFWFTVLSALAILAGGCPACGRSADKPELIAKMRPLGVSASPVIAAPGEPVHLTFHFALPTTETLTATINQLDDASGFTLPASGLALTNDKTATDSACDDHSLRCKFASFDYAALTAAFVVPPAAQLPMVPGTSVRMRYGITATSSSNIANVIGDLFVFAPGAPELTGAKTTAEILEPVAGPLGAGAAVPIHAMIGKYFDETARIGWFAGCGDIENRRAIATTWNIGGAGGCTLVFTARGENSRSFSIKIKDYSVQ